MYFDLMTDWNWMLKQALTQTVKLSVNAYNCLIFKDLSKKTHWKLLNLFIIAVVNGT